ncbi:hypothetical protein NUW58_g8630 [Xylaria curta]|uniref:Uncharacterized protein n=1 Tax=Xylaria curta TaxID=42375 RepID=A0ACC1N6B4_9PEZI|nr:hypothetical protein NUW58_g8630 [Xylaria curta]
MGGIEHVEKLMGETADAIAYQKEVSDMLGGRITNQDEDEVEDELAALEREVNGPGPLPAVPDTILSVSEPAEAGRERADRQAERRPERQAMLTS